MRSFSEEKRGTGLSLLTLVLLALASVRNISATRAEEPLSEPRIERLSDGFWSLESRHLILITDIAPDEDIKRLPLTFDCAMSLWGQTFGVSPERYQDTKATACLILDRNKFFAANYITDEVPKFREGYQYGDRLFMLEQPSPYYRVHLTLHEGTHWFMWKFLGGQGPPWMSEGVCEWLATHRTVGAANISPSRKSPCVQGMILPASRDEVPYWGRITLIRKRISSSEAPSLDAILRYTDTTHRTDEPYAWSWAAVQFFSHHEKCREKFEAMIRSDLGRSTPPSYEMTTDFKASLEADWRNVLLSWQAFLQDLQYGFDANRSALKFIKGSDSNGLKSTFQIEASRGWHLTGIRVKKNQSVSIHASGNCTLFQPSKRSEGASMTFSDLKSALTSQPQGITIKYQSGYPVGTLIAAIAPVDERGKTVDPSITPKWRIERIGAQRTWANEVDGELMMKINEDSSGLFDNSGSYEVEVEIR